MMLEQVQAMKEALRKQAFADAEDIPWYTTAAGATGGVLAGKKLLPKKYQAVGQIGGALLGTAAGLGVGKPLAKKLEKKSAVDPQKMVLLNRTLKKVVSKRGKEKKASPKDALEHEARTGNHAYGGPSPGRTQSPETQALTRKLQEVTGEAPKPPHPALTAAKTVGGMGVGILAGYGGMKAIDAGLKHVRGGRGLPKGSPLMYAVPIATGAGGLAYAHLQQRTLDKMREDHLKRQEMKRGSQDA
jgi:hypothetical protein